jgi:hypothetical protein
LKPLIQFQGSKSHIYCMAYALNQIVKDILKELKSGSMQETEDREIDAAIAGPVAKLQYIVVWIRRQVQQEQHWKRLSPSLKVGRDLDIQ